jgi:hypothetical protein
MLVTPRRYLAPYVDGSGQGTQAPAPVTKALQPDDVEPEVARRLARDPQKLDLEAQWQKPIALTGVFGWGCFVSTMALSACTMADLVSVSLQTSWLLGGGFGVLFFMAQGMFTAQRDLMIASRREMLRIDVIAERKARQFEAHV